MLYLINSWFVILSSLLFQVKLIDLQYITTPNNPFQWTNTWKNENATLWIIKDDINKYDIGFEYQDAFEHKQPFRAPVYYQKDNNSDRAVYRVIVSTRYLKKIVSTSYQIFLRHKKRGDLFVGPKVNLIVVHHDGPTEILTPNTEVVVTGTNNQKLLVTWDVTWRLPTLNRWILSLIRLGKNPKTIKHFRFVRDFDSYNYGYDFVRRTKIRRFHSKYRDYASTNYYYDIQEIGYYIPSDELVDGATYRVILKKYHGLEMYTSKKTFKQIGGKQNLPSSGKKNTKKILGGFFGGLATLVMVVFVFWFCQKLQKGESMVCADSETTSNSRYEDSGYGVDNHDFYPGLNENIRINYITRNEGEVRLPSYQEAVQSNDLCAPPPYPGLN